MQEIFKIVSAYSLEIVVGLVASVLMLLLLTIINGFRISNLKKKSESLLKILEFSDGEAMEKSILGAISFREDFESEIARINLEMSEMKEDLSKSIQNIGFIRYNAFGDMGSDLSFSVALLDENYNGVVVTSIYAREDSNVYAKPVVKGESEYKLSVEEIQAIDRAKKTKVEGALN
jgi:hypothetical protein